MLPVAEINPPVIKLPPVTLPVELTRPAVLMLPPVTLPVALTMPEIPRPPVLKVKMLVTPATLPMILPPLTGIFIVVVPLVNCVAAPTFPVATTPVSPAPLPVKSPAVIPLVITALLADRLPDAVTVTAVTSARLCIVPTLTMTPVTLRLPTVSNPVEFSVPAILTPVPVTVNTLAVPAEEITTFPLACGMPTLLDPLAMPETPPVLKS